MNVKGTNRVNNMTRHMLSFEPLLLLSSMLGLTGILSIYDWWQKDKVPIILLFILVGAVIVAAMYAGRKIHAVYLPGSSESKHFYPFLHQLTEADTSLPDEAARIIIPRAAEAAELHKLILSAYPRHVVIIGNSGAGKSTLIQVDLLKHSKNEDFFLFDEYETLVPDIVSHFMELFNQLPITADIDQETKHLLSAYEALKLVTTQAEIDKSTQRYLEAATEFCSAVSGQLQRHLILCFDQTERLLSQLSEQDADGRTKERLLGWSVIVFLQQLCHTKEIATLFAVRSDYASDYMGRFASPNDRALINPINNTLICAVLNSINLTQNDQAYNIFYTKFSALDSQFDFNSLSRALKLHVPSQANTFLTQLTGYMIEHFSTSDAEVRAIARGQTRDVDIIIDKFFEYLGNEYAFVSANKNAKKLLDIILFSIAVDNDSSGTSIKSVEIAQLAHIPTSNVDDCLEFLVRKGVAISTSQDGISSYRIVHDRLVDHLLRSDKLNILSDHRETITLLAERRVSKSEMIAPKPVPRLFNLLPRGDRPTIPQVLIVLMVLFCWLRLMMPELVFQWMTPVHAIYESVLPGIVQTFDFKPEYFLPIFVAQYLWVTFMYRLDRGYFAYVLKDKSKWARAVSASASPVGGFFGCLLVFTPSLFIVPIIVGGIGCAASYWLHSIRGDLRGPALDNSIELAGKTALNMTFSVGLTVILYLLLSFVNKGQTNLTSLIVIWFFCASYVWYWFAMASRQGSQEGWSTLLAIFDGGRTTDHITTYQ